MKKSETELYLELKKLEIELESTTKILKKELKKQFKDNIKIFNLINKEDDLRYKIAIIKNKLTIWNDDIYLKRLNTSNIDTKEYGIYLSRNSSLVGTIGYNGYHTSTFLGDISYIVKKGYQGNGYAYKALLLLSDMLYNDGVDSFYISSYKDNIPSISTIKKYGGIIIKDTDTYTCFLCKTKKLNKEKNKTR